MPEMNAGKRSSGGFAAPTEMDTSTDWRIPTNAATLRGRRLPGPDQSRYGTARTDPLGREGPGWHKGPSGLPVKDKGESK